MIEALFKFNKLNDSYKNKFFNFYLDIINEVGISSDIFNEITKNTYVYQSTIYNTENSLYNIKYLKYKEKYLKYKTKYIKLKN